MKFLPFKSAGLAMLISIGFATDAAAHNPTGRRRTGTIENVSSSTRRFTFRADREERAKTFVWNKRTGFVRAGGFVDVGALREGARADVTYHAPFFGEPFVSRVILLEPAPAFRARK